MCPSPHPTSNIDEGETYAAISAIVLSNLLSKYCAMGFFSSYFVERRWPEVAARIHHCSTAGLWRTGLWHLGFFAVSGLIFLLISLAVLDNFFPPSYWPGVIGLVACAWVVGIITPGAPSGLGVREGVLVFGLVNFAPLDEILLLVGLFRLVTVLGDLVFYLAASRYSHFQISSID